MLAIQTEKKMILRCFEEAIGLRIVTILNYLPCNWYHEYAHVYDCLMDSFKLEKYNKINIYHESKRNPFFKILIVLLTIAML